MFAVAYGYYSPQFFNEKLLAVVPIPIAWHARMVAEIGTIVVAFKKLNSRPAFDVWKNAQNGGFKLGQAGHTWFVILFNRVVRWAALMPLTRYPFLLVVFQLGIEHFEVQAAFNGIWDLEPDRRKQPAIVNKG